MTLTEPVTAATLKVVQPGGGRAGRLGPGVGVHFKIDGADTGGAIAVVEHPFEVGALVRPHVHTREDEISIVLEGEIGFRSEDDEVVLGAGGYIVKPRNQVHAMWNAGPAPARMIEIISPAGFEGFFRELVEMLRHGAPTGPERTALASRYGLDVDPHSIPRLTAQHVLVFGPSTTPAAEVSPAT